jgi:6,7-dimethyl-8-ribityllumazine synthase
MNDFKPRIAFVQSCWHKDLVDQIKMGFSSEMAALGTSDEHLDFFEVTGAFEIPLHAAGLPNRTPTTPSSPPAWSSTAASIATSSSPKQ